MIISNFERIGRPKAEYNAAGERTGHSPYAKVFSVLDDDDEAIGSITSVESTLNFSHLDVSYHEYEGRPYFKIKRTFKNLQEMKEYIANNGNDAKEVLKQAAAIKEVSFAVKK